jgi:hypothetical protein
MAAYREHRGMNSGLVSASPRRPGMTPQLSIEPRCSQLAIRIPPSLVTLRFDLPSGLAAQAAAHAASDSAPLRNGDGNGYGETQRY